MSKTTKRAPNRPHLMQRILRILAESPFFLAIGYVLNSKLQNIEKT